MSIIFKKEQLGETLKKDLGIEDNHLDLVINKLNRMDDTLKAVFQLWLQTGQIQDTKIEGYSLSYFMKERDMSFLAAMLNLDWLIRNPERAKDEIEKLQSSIII